MFSSTWKFIVSILFVGILCTIDAFAGHRYVIPLTEPGAAIYVQNSYFRTQHIRVENGATVYDYVQRPESTYFMAGGEVGFVVVTSDEEEVKTWSSYKGAEFFGMEVGTLRNRRFITIMKDALIVVASAWDKSNPVTFRVYSGDWPRELDGSFALNGWIAAYGKDLFPWIPDGPVLVMVTSEMPLSIGVVRQTGSSFETFGAKDPE